MNHAARSRHWRIATTRPNVEGVLAWPLHAQGGTGKVHVKRVPNTQRQAPQGQIREHVEAGSEVFTDEGVAYDGLDREYVHQLLNHAETYVKGDVHTDRIENFWSCLKPGLKRTHISVETFHLFRYRDEQPYRFNNRKSTDAARFIGTIAGVMGSVSLIKS